MATGAAHKQESEIVDPIEVFRAHSVDYKTAADLLPKPAGAARALARPRASTRRRAAQLLPRETRLCTATKRSRLPRTAQTEDRSRWRTQDRMEARAGPRSRWTRERRPFSLRLDRRRPFRGPRAVHQRSRSAAAQALTGAIQLKRTEPDHRRRPSPAARWVRPVLPRLSDGAGSRSRRTACVLGSGASAGSSCENTP